MNDSIIFFNRCFDKKRLKNFILWFFNKYGERETIKLTEDLKKIGFQYATKAGISIGIDDLRIPFIKPNCIEVTEQRIKKIEINNQRGNITEIERQQQFVYEWSLVSERLKRHVIQFFKATDVFNPIYMMTFSGARGNISQIRQLIGMRGLMADPQGQILDFPIRSSFREGLTLTEYLISCYGARKGVVDTALRTATSGYLTRRLVDVTQQVVIGRQNCQTNRGIHFADLSDGNKVLLQLKERLVGRVLLRDVFRTHPVTKNKYKICSKNQEISSRLSIAFNDIEDPIILRSPLTCYSKNSICQLCYGWNLAYNAIVSIGEAVGVLAAQSIGEPGTQLTMRTFHTGGVFTGGLIDQIYAPFDGEVNYLNHFKGVLVRTLKGKVGFLTKAEGSLQVKKKSVKESQIIEYNGKQVLINLFFSAQFNKNSYNKKKITQLLKKIWLIEVALRKRKNITYSSLTFNIPVHTILFIRQGVNVLEKDLIAELSSSSTSSILNNRSLESEQETLTPISGQVFFENLVLIEKIKRDGSAQKMTYGLGLLWVVAATHWMPPICPSIFPSEGDFITHSSTFQKLQVIIEKSYYLDTKIVDSIQNFKNFKSNKFGLISESKLCFNKRLSFSRVIQSFLFQKVYYQNTRYFVSINLKNCFIGVYLFRQTNSLSTHDYFIKKNHIKLKLENLTLGLNFNFYQNNPISRVQKLKSKSNFLLYTVHNFLSNQNGKFFLLTQPLSKIKAKQRKLISSRTRFDFRNLVFQEAQHYNWENHYYQTSSSLSSFSPWKFYTKISKNENIKFFDLGFLNPSNSLVYSKDKYIKLSKIRNNTFESFLVLKYFYKRQKFYQFFLCFKAFQIPKNQNWGSISQPVPILINRQTEINGQFSGFWKLPSPNIFTINLSFHYFRLANRIQTTSLFNKKTSYISNFLMEDGYNIKSIARPILLSPNLLKKYYTNKVYIVDYLVQNFFISFYYQYLLNLKFNNYFFHLRNKKSLKIGSQVQFKLRIFPIFRKNKEGIFRLTSKVKNLFFKQDFFIHLQKNSLLKLFYKKQQIFKSWPCLSIVKTLPDNFSICSNFASGYPSQLYLNQQLIIADFIYYNNSLKNSIYAYFSHAHFHNIRPRFLICSTLSGSLILFQKFERLINLYHSKKLNLNNNCNFENQELCNLLSFNFLKTYFHTFDKLSLTSKRRFNPLFLEKSNTFFPKKGVRKAEFLQILKVKAKTLFNLNYPFFFKNYSVLNQKTQKNFYFSNLRPNENKAKLDFLKYLNYFSAKSFQFITIKKVDFPSYYHTKVDKSNLIRIFYKNFRPFQTKNLVYIKFFSSYVEGEIINASPKSLILARANLKTLLFNKLRNLLIIDSFKLGDFIRYGDSLNNRHVITESGQIIYMDKYQWIIRQAIPFLITSKSLLNVYQNEVIKRGSRLFTFLSQRLKTGDIVQGIPKIEEFFEARLTREGLPLVANLHIQIKQLFQFYKTKYSIFEAAQKSFETIQYLIINEIQKVYCSQGIYIADKHLEIVVRQMTTKVQIIKGGPTGLLSGELVELDWVRLIEKRFMGEDIIYEPIILGITKSCLETDSFISAASFQETTRILTKAAIQNKIDFIRGLKQNVILGNLVPAGTGFFSPLYIKYSKIE